jgi:DNA anti-recombination protein RmuC
MNAGGVEAKTDAERQMKLNAHVRQVRDHIRVLGRRDAGSNSSHRRNSSLFLPLEPLLAAALDGTRTSSIKRWDSA